MKIKKGYRERNKEGCEKKKTKQNKTKKRTKNMGEQKERGENIRSA